MVQQMLTHKMLFSIDITYLWSAIKNWYSVSAGLNNQLEGELPQYIAGRYDGPDNNMLGTSSLACKRSTGADGNAEKPEPPSADQDFVPKK
ncbi:unnamed protein product [Eruca vesicaria subsp. sativa]|uniref:Uncharacterized protein n=1 Tax=Eruca vesicaria subsp. sativa TaxID=29727 RepID=A0ABC8JIP2_ERUVS|nr:unnamed protein product [Eruca vesicaria subsp. sativa]